MANGLVMTTFTINLPDNLNVPSNWDVQAFVLEKLYADGLIPSCPAVQTVVNEEDDAPDSWFTPEERKQMKENRRRLDEEATKNPPRYSKDDFYQILLNGPVADEETIKRQDEVREHIKQWTIKSW